MRARRTSLLFTLLVFATAAAAHAADLEACDVDEYISKPIGVEETWLENAAYLFAQADNNGSPNGAALSPEIEARLNQRLGVEIDLPGYVTPGPVGRSRGAFGPLGVGLKVALSQTCDMSSGRATLITAEVEGQTWLDPRPDLIPGAGNTVAAQLMWASLWYPWFTSGEAGWSQAVGAGPASGWYVNAGFGRAVGQLGVQLEVELDDQLLLATGARGIEGSLMPQIAWHPSPLWSLAIGEQAAMQQGGGRPQLSTWVMLEREF